MKTSLHLRPLALTLLALPLAAHDTEEHKVLASDGVAGDGFGRSVSLHESTMAVGAPFAGGTGAVYVFSYDGVDWTEEAKLVPSDGAAGDHFGRSVSVSHETIIVGAPKHGAAGAAAGAAYVFVHDGLSWNEEAKLQSSTIAAADVFGSAVTLDDDTAVVGAPRNLLGGAPAIGSAFVFVRSGTVWTEEAELTAADGVLANQFGTSLAVHHDTLVVGAARQNGVAANSGAAYVYDRAGTVWSQTQKLRANDGATNDFFGASVAMFEDELIVVGVPGDDDTGKNAGSTYQYNLGATSWQAGVKRFGSKAGDVFGNAVAHSYRTTIVGSRLADSGVGNDTGAAYLYANFGTRTGFEVFVASDPVAGKFLGSSVAMTSCLIGVGAMRDAELGADAGAVYTYVVSHPKVTVNNGSGANPLCMTTVEPPAIGSHWEIEVDASGFPGAAFTLIVVHNAMRATPQVLSFGEIMVARRSGLIFSSIEPGSGINLHEFEIPLDPYLTGLDLAAQAIVRSSVSGAPILGACNAELVRIGCAAEGGHHTP